MRQILLAFWDSALYSPIFEALKFFYHLLGDSFGLAIIALTVAIRAVLVPLTIPSIKAQQKMLAIQPEIEKLKKKHQDDKPGLQKAQLELMKTHGVNPGAGCLPQIVQIAILIALYQVFNNFLNGGQIDGNSVNMSFLWLDLSRPDRLYIFPILAGLTQLVYSLMLRPGAEHPHIKEELKMDKKEKQEEKTEMGMAQEIQNQMLFMMPLMTVIISLRFPSGLSLYWVITTVFSVIQQWFITGPGGLKYYWTLAKAKLPHSYHSDVHS